MNSTLVGALEMRATLGARGVDASLSVPAGQVVAVLGPNGAGKSTLLSLISGLERPDSGRLSVDRRVLVDTRDGRWVPPHHRGVALLAQQPLLFPHLTVLANVAFGPRSSGRSRSDAEAAARQWLSAVDALEFAGRKPAALSGGQAQRVALARALAAEPAVILLDEPLSALDVAVAPGVRQVLRRVLRDSGRTALIVTHDILDALALADRAIVMEGGRIVEDGPVREVLSRPRSAFAARIAGVNLLAGTAQAHGLLTPDGHSIAGLADPACVTGGPAVAIFRPSAVAVHLTPPTGSPRNHFAVTVAELEPRGEVIRVRAADTSDSTTGFVADLTAAAVADLNLTPGMRVHFAVKATEVSVYPAASAPAERFPP